MKEKQMQVMLKLLAALTGFFLVGAAAILGHAWSHDTSNHVTTLGAIGLCVGAAAFVHGLAFGRAGLASGSAAVCVALVVTSLPFQVLYATTESFVRYAISLALIAALAGLACFLGTLARTRWATHATATSAR